MSRPKWQVKLCQKFKQDLFYVVEKRHYKQVVAVVEDALLKQKLYEMVKPVGQPPDKMASLLQRPLAKAIQHFVAAFFQLAFGYAAVKFARTVIFLVAPLFHTYGLMATPALGATDQGCPNLGVKKLKALFYHADDEAAVFDVREIQVFQPLQAKVRKQLKPFGLSEQVVCLVQLKCVTAHKYTPRVMGLRIQASQLAQLLHPSFKQFFVAQPLLAEHKQLVGRQVKKHKKPYKARLLRDVASEVQRITLRRVVKFLAYQLLPSG